VHGFRLPGWLQKLVGTLGGGGLFLVAFLDSSVLSFPLVSDGLMIEMSITHPDRMPYYAVMAAIGSLAGCIWLYWLAQKGGEAFFHRHAGTRAAKVRKWVEKNAFLTVFLPAVLPPPCPFKVFVLAEGVFQVPLRMFVLALLLGRGIRFFGEGFLAVRYGNQALHMVAAHSVSFVLSVFGLLVVIYIAGRLLFRHSGSVE
jgi:membrane protein YqaA with SNARE-associated domain